MYMFTAHTVTIAQKHQTRTVTWIGWSTCVNDSTIYNVQQRCISCVHVFDSKVLSLLLFFLVYCWLKPYVEHFHNKQSSKRKTVNDNIIQICLLLKCQLIFSSSVVSLFAACSSIPQLLFYYCCCFWCKCFLRAFSIAILKLHSQNFAVVLRVVQ